MTATGKRLFAANGFGFGFAPAEFRDITSDRDLRRISPGDVLGSRRDCPPGYERHFPRFTRTVRFCKRLISLITELIDRGLELLQTMVARSPGKDCATAHHTSGSARPDTDARRS